MKKNIISRTIIVFLTIILFGCSSESSTTNSPENPNPSLKKWVKIDAGMGYSLGLLEDGSLWSWGDNQNGNAGLGSLSDSNLPVKIFDANVKECYISEGLNSNYVIKNDGTLWTTGKNGSGNNWLVQTCFGTSFQTYETYSYYRYWGPSSNKTQYTQLGSDGNWSKLYLKNNNTIWAFSCINNFTGYYYDNFPCGGGSWRGNPEVINNPIQINSDNDWKDVKLGAFVAYGIKNDGTLWRWGYMFGMPQATIPPNIFPINADNDWLKIQPIQGQNLTVLKTDGTIWNIPEVNEFGQTLNNPNDIIPTQIGNSNWKTITGSDYANKYVGIKPEGTLWAWGNNSDGFLGDGTYTDQIEPIQISDKSNWRQVVIGNSGNPGAEYFLAIDDLGNIWGWGKNDKGQLGDETYTDKYVPTLLISAQ